MAEEEEGKQEVLVGVGCGLFGCYVGVCGGEGGGGRRCGGTREGGEGLGEGLRGDYSYIAEVLERS